MRRSRNWTKPALVLCSTTAVLSTLLILNTPALAGRGVQYVHFDPALTLCIEDQWTPCGEYQGIGNSNTIEVHQQKINGQHVFRDIQVPGIPDGNIWVAASYGAKCKVGYSPKSARVYLENRNSHQQGEGLEVGPTWDGWYVPHDAGDRTIPDAVIDMWVPLDTIFERPGEIGTQLWGFPTLESIFEYGESIVESRMAAGMSEGQARALPFEEETFLAMHGSLICEGNTWGRIYARKSGELLPITIKFVGDPTVAMLEQGEEPPEPGSPDLTFDTAVVQAQLSVMLDPADECRLALSGVVVTNGVTDVTYRFVNELGMKSQIYSTTVDQTYTAYLDNTFQLPVFYPGEGGGLGGLVAEGDGELGGLTVEETDNVQGTFMIEILEPHPYESNIAGYNVEPCYGNRGAGQDLVVDRDPGSRPPLVGGLYRAGGR